MPSHTQKDFTEGGETLTPLSPLHAVPCAELLDSMAA